MTDEDEREWPVLCGVRRSGEAPTSLGFYRPYATPSDEDEDTVQIQFRPLLSGLTHEEAERLAQVLRIAMKDDLEQLKQLAEVLGQMTQAERTALLAMEEPNQPALEIDL